MFDSPIVNLALSLSFAYFILSLTVSTVHEFIYSVLSCKRGLFLKTAIWQLFYNDKEWEKIVAKIWDSPHIKALQSDGNQYPSYIPAKNFALALMDQFRDPDQPQLLDMNEIRAVLTGPDKQGLVTGELRKILLGLFERAEGDLTLFQKQIEKFYNDAMERAAGIYTRSTRKAMLVISLVLAIAVNADTINIAKQLWSNPTSLAQTADKVTAAVQNISRQSDSKSPADLKFNGDQVTVIQVDTTVRVPTGDSTQKDTITVKKLAQQIKGTVVYLQNTGIPIGWSAHNIPEYNPGDKDGNGKTTEWDLVFGWIFKLFGFALTAAALSLGAPFWFDLLNKIVNLRAAGKKPDDNNTSSRSASNDPSANFNAVG